MNNVQDTLLRILAECKRKGLSVNKMLSLSGQHSNVINSMKARGTMPAATVIASIATTLGVTSDYLLGLSENSVTNTRIDNGESDEIVGIKINASPLDRVDKEILRFISYHKRSSISDVVNNFPQATKDDYYGSLLSLISTGLIVELSNEQLQLSKLGQDAIAPIIPAKKPIDVQPKMKDDTDDRLIASYGEVKEQLSEDDIDDIELFIRMKAERKKKIESERE